MKRLLLFLAPLLLTGWAGYALIIQDHDPAVNDRFASGYPDAPVPNTDAKFLGKGMDLSGVGWWKREPRYSVALISSRNFACAKHLSPEAGDGIVFLGGDGHLHEYHVAKVQPVELGKKGDDTVYADTAIGTLEETVPADDQVTHYPVAFSRKGIEPFIGKQILMYGHMAKLGINEIEEGILVPGVSSEFNFDTTALSTGWGKSEPGDSGSPSFIVIGGKPALVGTHWKDDTDSMVSGLIPQIDTMLTADGERLNVVPLGD